eukprot:COSAG01_NODE_1347_length_10632_cov_29.175370_3_plen_2601_part_00
MDGLLECVGRIMSASVSRKDRKELVKRTDVLLEGLDMDESPAWLVSAWTEDQVDVVVEASEALWAAEKTPDMSGDAGSIVSSVLAALEEVVESHVDKAEALLGSMQSGESDQVVVVLEHGLTLLEKLSMSTPRKVRKAIKELSEQVEHVIDGLDEDGAMEQLASCELSDLTALAEQLTATSSLDGDAGDGCVSTVKTMLATLTRCRDPVLQASRRLASMDASARMHGLETLRSLQRVVLAAPVIAEVAATAVVVEIGADISRDCAERQAAAMSVFALGFRNGVATTEVLGKFLSEGTAVASAQIYANELSGRDGVALWTAMFTGGYCMLYEFGLKGETAALRGAAEKQLLTGFGKLSRLDCTRARYAELLPILLELFEHDDIVVASSAAKLSTDPLVISAAACAPVLVASREYPDAILALLRRIDGTQQLRRPAAWWKARSEAVHLDSVCLNAAYTALVYWSGVLPTLPPNSAACEELLAESIHVCMMNKEAELSAKPQVVWAVLIGVLRVVVLAAREQFRHKSLLASGAVDALLWTTAHDSVFTGASLAESSASTTVALIGRNEGGLTLTHETVDTVLNVVHMYWDTTSTHWRVKSAAKAPVTKLIGKIQPVVDMVIADANKPFVLEHPTAIDDLVKGLLVDHSSPRRTQDGAGQLQEVCALALQNLALSDVGKGPLRSHSSVIVSLRAVASAEGGMSEKARQYASGALFELDEVARQKAKEAAAAAKAAAQSDGGEAAEHVMLSYNWDHQDVIKRINTSLKGRGYAVWIDIEKMQGSTVEAMADAVEDAAVVCYGISNAYKESVNCRMEAQYAFQQQTDMVPLMLEEGYRAKGWLGMILGMRLWYGFYGSTLASEGAFESKMEELCRELGERGTRAASQTTVGTVAAPPLAQDPATRAALMSDGDPGGRIDVVDGLLECIGRMIPASVSRKDRKDLTKRTDALLEDLDKQESAEWLVSVWTEEQAVGVVKVSEALWAAGKTPGMSSGDVASIVSSVLAALEEVVASHVDQAEVLLASMQGGESDQVVAVLEHGLALLEKLSVSSTRKARKAIDELCEQVERAMEGLGEDGAMEQLASCEVSELTALAGQLKATSSFDGDAGDGCIQVVKTMLETLTHCLDPVLRSSRELTSADAATCMRGLETLRGLPRVVLAEPVAAEVAVAAILVEIELDIDRDCAERQAAAMGVFAVGFRNGAATIEVLGKLYAEGAAAITAPWFANELSGRDGVALAVASAGCFWLLFEFGTKSETAALRGAVEKQILTGLGKTMRLDCTRARYAELLPMLLELLEHDDIVVASCAANGTIWPIMTTAAVCAPVLVASREYPDAILALMRRIQCTRQLRRPAAWWKERSEAVHLDSICLSALATGPQNFSGVSPTMPPNSAAWEELLAESIHVCKINQELSAQPKIGWQVMLSVLRIVAWAAREQSRHKSLLASGVVDALLWITAHDSVWVGVALAESSAAATVALIGRNEGGLTLTRETVHTVLDCAQMCWDTSSTHWRVRSAAKASVIKVIGRMQPIVDMVIADANKPFVLEHDTAIDDLVKGLLVDHSSPRRTQDGAGKLQEVCALALQNLALSDVGKGPLRSHSSVITSLRVVASAEGGLTEKARQYAAGALFELDEVARQKAKEAAAAAKAAAQTDDGEAAEHVMLSYNWGHQDVIKRINTALKGRGYTVWIDIEKMQGSTVEAMADAVEEAAVVCYGISAAYKESVNCRMEAQYAFQQQTDMVPLMLEEGYSPNGWLGMLLGVRLWYGFYGSTLSSTSAFEGKVEELCRELGERGLRSAAEPVAQEQSNTAVGVSSADTLATQLKAGGSAAEAMVMSFLEHALEVTEAVVSKIPRQQRKEAKALCDRLECMLEQPEAGQAVRLASCEEAQLAHLGETMQRIQGLPIQEADIESVASVEAALAELEHCSDVVAAAGRQLTSVVAVVDDRLLGLQAVTKLPRLSLEEPVAAEVKLIPILQEVVLDKVRSCMERQAAGLAIVTVGLRNAEAAAAALTNFAEPGLVVAEEIYAGQLDGKEGLGVLAIANAISSLCVDLIPKIGTAVRDKCHPKMMRSISVFFKRVAAVWTKQRVEALMPYAVQALTDDTDVVLAAGMAECIVGFVFLDAKHELSAQPPAILLAAEPLMLARCRQVAGQFPAAAWWKARSTVVTVDTACLTGLWNGLLWLAIKFAVHISDETLAEAIHMVKVNREAELSAQDRSPAYILNCTHGVTKCVMAAVSEARRDAVRATPGLVDALLYSVEHDIFSIYGNSIADTAARTLIPLIGRNEGGMTLSRPLVSAVLDRFHWCFFTGEDASNWQVARYQSKPAKAVATEADTVIKIMAIADANKPYILQHSTVIDDLVSGLLLEESNPRRGQEQCDKLQEACAAVLQTLALSDIGKQSLQSRHDVVQALHQVVDGGLTEASKRHASGALFELDEKFRQQTKAASKAMQQNELNGGGSGSDADGVVVEHVMLSYNWGHQDVVKRINAALKVRGYTVWIDVERMQGSTVEAMAAAVEGAAVFCYGISQAYKESSNCRLEAQYAYQQEKDMVPLMLEEGYRANGWLGMLLGVRLYYAFVGPVLEDEASFEGKVEELCRELGSRGKA